MPKSLQARISAAIGLWKTFSDLDLSEAKKSHFTSVQDCFTRELKEGARSIDQDPATLVSPCDAIVGASGTIHGGTVVQAKGFPYTLLELLGDATHAKRFEGGSYVTLSITPTMYHRFHAPHYRKGEEMGWFQHGSTIIALAPRGVSLSATLREGQRIRMGEPLFRINNRRR